MKTLVVYYSRTGTTKKIGERIAKELGCDVEQVHDVRPRQGAIGYMRSGREAMKRQCPEIKPTTKDISGYDLVVIGTPIWGWNMCSPIRTYLESNKENMPRVAFFATQGGSGSDKAFREMEAICDTVPKATITFFTKEVQANNYDERLMEFVEKLRKDDVEEEQ